MPFYVTNNKRKTFCINRTCYYFDDILGVVNRDGGILLDEKLYKEKDEKILIHDISYRTLTNAKSFRVRFVKVDEFVKTHNGCFVLFDYWWFDKICGRIKYLISEKSGIKDSINHNLGKSELIHIIHYLLKKY